MTYHQNRDPEVATETFEEIQKELHEEAGLIYSGENEEGEKEYIGTNKQWEKYEELTNKNYGK